MPNKINNSVILVTGGAGFIGSHLVDELITYGPKKVIIIDNLIRGSIGNMAQFIRDPRIQFHQADIRNQALLENCVKQADYVIHMAALRINACAANPNEGFDVMLKSTFELANFCVKYHIKKIVYSSSASVYGLAQHFPTPETDNPYNNQTFYGGAKLWGEQLLKSFKFMYGLDYVALRYFNVYGPRMDTDGKYTEVMIKWLDCIRMEKRPQIFGDGSTTMDFVHVKDVAHANILALQSEVTDEAFNIGCQKETSLKGLLEKLLEANESYLKPEFREENSVNPVSRRLADISKANQQLGYTPTISLEQGLRELSEWYFKNQRVGI